MTTPYDDPVFRDSVQSRAEAKPFGDVPIGHMTAPMGGDLYDSGLIFHISQLADNIPTWSIYPHARDRAVRVFFKQEPIVSGAVYSMAARIKSLHYALSGNANRFQQIKDLLNNADFGNGLPTLIEKTIQDVSTQDNGAFWELIGKGNPDRPMIGPPTGVDYLDSAQCYRSFDPEYPVIYISPYDGKRHRLHRTRVVAMSSLPQPNELARDIGFSPVGRALLSVQLMRSIMQYRYEKSSGQFERAIGYATGVTLRTLNSLVRQTQNINDNEGFTRIGNIPFIASMKPIDMGLVDLASIPDGFELKSETEIYVYILALCFGVDAREFWPATVSGATRADASIQNMKARGKGLADLIQIVEDAIVRYLIPSDVGFEFDFVDDEHDEYIATKRETVTRTILSIKKEGIITDEQAQAILIHEGVLDKKILESAGTLAVIEEEPEKPQEAPQPPNIPENSEETQETPSEGQDDIDEEEEKAITTYRRSLRSAGRGLYNLVYDQPNFILAMDSTIRRGLTQAWLEGMALEGIKEGDMTTKELSILQEIIESDMSYVVPLSEYIISIREDPNRTITPVLDRMDTWVSRYDQVKYKAQLLAAGNKKKKWVFNPAKEHCGDCAKLHGRVYRAEIWAKYNIEPRSPLLECFGIHCGCGLEDTDEPAMKGKPPALYGQKMSYPEWTKHIKENISKEIIGMNPEAINTLTNSLKKFLNGDEPLEQWMSING